ncbi:MAG: DNA repair protein RecN [Clostridiales Family XIII bacterium]|jgi:DNA repair protein RecN (Recombination protein N)|nr:DNA repair protein RecN [Clostridiales Family XIII bacterium]
MISHILIKDFAIIENIDVDLYPGLNIITGETGAGKSIIIEAISMALGSRADTAMVRAGRSKAVIQLVIDESEIPDHEKTGIELLGREISASGKSICRIDGEIVTLGQLNAATKHIADIHGQYDHQSLLDPDNHIGLIDASAADRITPAKERVRESYASYITVKKRLDALLSGEAASKRELDFLRYEVREIDATAPKSGEHEALSNSLKVMQNSEKIFECLSRSYEAVTNGNPSAADNIGRALSTLRGICEFSDDYRDMANILSECYYNLEEVAGNIRGHMDRMDFTRQALDDTIARLDALDRLIAKYGGGAGDGIENVIAYRERAEERLSNIENIDERKAELAAEVNAARESLVAESLILSKLRRKAAEALESGINRELHELNFRDAEFNVRFAANEDAEIAPADFTENGIDRVEFLLSANKGQPLLPVARVASGGEMSRIMLALKAVTGDFDHIPTMVFDEIDSGISGVTASIVGEKLLRMAKTRQIICITHLPQIAAFADHHFMIQKSSDDKTTYTTIAEIAGDDQVLEIARLLGGKNITPNTINSAKELIALSR